MMIFAICSNGIIKDRYSDGTYDNLRVGCIPEGAEQNIEFWSKNVSEVSNVILRVRASGERDIVFRNGKQYVTVLEVIKGDGMVKAGDDIAVAGEGHVFAEIGGMNIGYVNFMQKDNEYLIFLEGKARELYKGEVVYAIHYDANLLFPYINVADKSSVPTGSQECLYEEYRDNEYFCTTQDVLDLVLEYKENILEQYGIVTSK